MMPGNSTILTVTAQPDGSVAAAVVTVPVLQEAPAAQQVKADALSKVHLSLHLKPKTVVAATRTSAAVTTGLLGALVVAAKCLDSSPVRAETKS